MHQIICNIIPHNWSCRSCLLQLNSLPSDCPPLSMLAACCFRLAQYNALALSSREGQKISLAFSLPPSLPSSFPYVVITINHRHYKDKSHPSLLPSFLPSTVHCTSIIKVFAWHDLCMEQDTLACRNLPHRLWGIRSSYKHIQVLPTLQSFCRLIKTYYLKKNLRSEGIPSFDDNH